MTKNTDQECSEFEAWATANNKYHVSGYNPHSDLWEAWQASRRATAETVISEAQVLAITTAYEQGVGKGHQSYDRKEAITNPYGDEWGCDSAWQMGYDEGREQAERKAPAPQSLAGVSAPDAQTDAKDAARYRWLRDNDLYVNKDLEPEVRLQLNAIWDVKIDEAMAAQAKQGGEHA